MKQINESFSDWGLVLEGGAMRGIFTCGVLDWFMDNNIHFPYTVGVSAGACNGASYISNQRGRARFSNIDLLDQYHYIGFRHYLKKRNLLDFDLLFDDFPNRILPFDFDRYVNVQKRFEIVVSNCLTGKAEYFEEYHDHTHLLSILRASSSMPLFSPIVNVDETPMLDGGVCDPIPIGRAFDQGFKKLVVVLTRNKGYRKKENKMKLPRWIYRKYPQLREALNIRNQIYNKELELVEKLETEDHIIVIRPTEQMTIERIEKNTTKLDHFYKHGYSCAQKKFESLIN